MNTRALSIIKILLNSVEPVSSLALSQEIGCSTKTIQNEIKEVNKELKNCEIVSIRGIGYKIEGNLDDIDIKNSDLYDYDRVEYIIKKIINLSSTDKDTIKLEDLADSMYVSLSTVKNDLKEVKKILNEYNSNNMERIIDEVGDLLFACVNLARLLKVDEEEALNKESKKFARRFKYVEDKVLQNNKSMKDVSIDELNKFWDEAKINE